ncbi:MAG: hypothetical protein U0793_12515 [Gemmataceae bacterium]
MSLVASLLTVLFGGDDPSGPMVGDKLPEFKVADFPGPSEGKEFKLVKGAKTSRSWSSSSTRSRADPATDAAHRRLHHQKEEKLATQFVWLGEKEKMEGYLKRAQGSSTSSPR